MEQAVVMYIAIDAKDQTLCHGECLYTPYGASKEHPHGSIKCGYFGGRRIPRRIDQTTKRCEACLDARKGYLALVRVAR